MEKFKQQRKIMEEITSELSKLDATELLIIGDAYVKNNPTDRWSIWFTKTFNEGDIESAITNLAMLMMKKEGIIKS
jgi:hypothetical protein